MHIRLKRLIGTAALILTLCGVMPAKATLITNSYVNTTYDRVGRYYDGSSNRVSANSYVGQFDGGGSVDWNDRSFFIYTLPALEPGQTIVSATLKTALLTIDNPVYDVDVYHVQDLNHGDPLVGDDYDAGTATLTAASFVTPDSASGWHLLDVLSDVLADYANDPSGEKYATFRFQLQNETPVGVNSSADGAEKRYYFTTDSTKLILEIIPEPASVSLFLVAGLSVALIRRRLRS